MPSRMAFSRRRHSTRCRRHSWTSDRPSSCARSTPGTWRKGTEASNGLDEERLRGRSGKQRLHVRVVRARLVAFRRVQELRQKIHVAHAVKEDAGTAQGPTDGEVDVGLLG